MKCTGWSVPLLFTHNKISFSQSIQYITVFIDWLYKLAVLEVCFTCRTLSISISARRHFSQQKCLLHFLFGALQNSPVSSKTLVTIGQPHTSSAPTCQ